MNEEWLTPEVPSELNQSSLTQPEGEKTGLAPRIAISPADFDEGMWWVIIDMQGKRLAKSFATEKEADAAAGHVAMNKSAKVVVLTPGTISASKNSPIKEEEVSREIEKCLSRSASFDRVSFVVHVPGHKNSDGEPAPWVIKSHETGKIISSHKSESEANAHLQEMHIFGGHGYLPGQSQSFPWPRRSDDQGRKDDKDDQEAHPGSETPSDSNPGSPAPSGGEPRQQEPSVPSESTPSSPSATPVAPNPSLDPMVASHPAFVKAYEESRPLLEEMSQKYGLKATDPELWVKVYKYAHDALLTVRVYSDMQKQNPTAMSSRFPGEVEKIKAMTPEQIKGMMAEAEHVSASFLSLSFLAQLAKMLPDPEMVGQWLDIRKSGLIVGASGFGHENWKDGFYPKAMLSKDRIGFYAKRFSAVEITSTRHSVPHTRVLENWAKATPAGFMFCFCAPIAVRPSNGKSAEIMATFMRRVATVGSKLGPVVIRVPADEYFSDGDADRFFSALPLGRYAIQVDSEEWKNQEVLGEMLKRDIVIVDDNLGTTATDILGWGYKRIRAGEVGMLRMALKQAPSTSLVFVEDKSPGFPSKEMMQAFRDLGYKMGPDDVKIMEQYLGPRPTNDVTGPANSAAPSGSYQNEVDQPIAVESEDPDDKNQRFAPGKSSTVSPPTDWMDSLDANDGATGPKSVVDGNTNGL